MTTKKKTTSKNTSSKKTLSKKTSTLERDFGEAPQEVQTYEPIMNFDKRMSPKNFIIVKMNHELLDSMLQKLTQKSGANSIGVPCRKVD